MAAGLEPRSELRPEEQAEVQKQIVATQAYLDILNEIPSPNQNPSTWTGAMSPPPPKQNASQSGHNDLTHLRQNSSQYRANQSVTIERSIPDWLNTPPPPPPNPRLVPPAIKGGGLGPLLPENEDGSPHWFYRYAFPYIGLGVAIAVIVKLLGA